MVKKQMTKTKAKAQDTKIKAALKASGQRTTIHKSEGLPGYATQKCIVVSTAKSGPFQNLPEDVRNNICCLAEDNWRDLLLQLAVPACIIMEVGHLVPPAL